MPEVLGGAEMGGAEIRRLHDSQVSSQQTGLILPSKNLKLAPGAAAEFQRFFSH